MTAPVRPPTAAERRAALQVPGASIRNGRSRVVFHGKAGTGKTTELLKVALAHALEGRLTLVCCYTKVLAAELRARMAALPGFADVDGNLLVVDLGQLSPNDEDSIGFGGFQTICVDEAQDVAQEKFDRLQELAASDAEWFLSDAPEQALYDQRSEFMNEAVEIARANGTWEPKRVDLRSGIAERLVCDAALEIAPYAGQVRQWVEAHPIRTAALEPEAEQEVLDLEVTPVVRGHLPEIVRLPADTKWDVRVGAYERIIRGEVDAARRNHTPLDLAILTVRAEDMSGEWKKIKVALGNLDVPFLDQVESANRRRSPELGQVRLSTVHSMRGVDADRVILLDLEGMEKMPEERRGTLLNIALSRARKGSTVVSRPMEAIDGSYRAFVESLVAAYRAQAGA